MHFRNKKRTEWWIIKLVDGQWEVEWEHFKTEREAEKALNEEYEGLDHSNYYYYYVRTLATDVTRSVSV